MLGSTAVRGAISVKAIGHDWGAQPQCSSWSIYHPRSGVAANGVELATSRLFAPAIIHGAVQAAAPTHAARVASTERLVSPPAVTGDARPCSAAIRPRTAPETAPSGAAAQPPACSAGQPADHGQRDRSARPRRQTGRNNARTTGRCPSPRRTGTPCPRKCWGMPDFARTQPRSAPFLAGCRPRQSKSFFWQISRRSTTFTAPP